MNSPARRCVNAIPEASNRCSISPCILAKRNAELSSGMIPDSFATYFTPAFLAASIKFDCTSSMSGADDEISIARSTSRKASASVSGRAMSPCTSWTCGSAAIAAALAGSRTSARTATPRPDSTRSNSLPFSPVAPVTRIMARLLFGPPKGYAGFGAGRSDNASMDKNDTMDFFRSCSYRDTARRRMVRSDDMANAKSTLTCGCPVAAFQKMISGKYKLRIVWDLQDGPKRYSEIRTGLVARGTGTAEIAPRVLSRELKALNEQGFIDRKDYDGRPPKVEYRLSIKGRHFVSDSDPFR